MDTQCSLLDVPKYNYNRKRQNRIKENKKYLNNNVDNMKHSLLTWQYQIWAKKRKSNSAESERNNVEWMLKGQQEQSNWTSEWITVKNPQYIYYVWF